MALGGALLIGPHVIKIDPFFDHFCAFMGCYMVIRFFARTVSLPALPAKPEQEG